MRKKTLLFLAISLFCSFPMALRSQGNVPIPGGWWGEDDRYLFYRGASANSSFLQELIYHLWEKEEIEGKTYLKVYDRLTGKQQGEQATYSIHIRQDGKRLLVRYDEYKQFMHESRGIDMSDFDGRCRYEVTSDGEMVLYDFGMVVGDKFCSVPGQEDVIVTGYYQPYFSPQSARKDLKAVVLSNGAVVLEDVGFLYRESSVDGLAGDFFDYLGNEQNGSMYLCCSQVGSTTIYENMFDNGGVGNNEVALNDTKKDIGAIQAHRHFDLQGRWPTKPVGKNIYIKNGKKVVSNGYTVDHFSTNYFVE